MYLENIADLLIYVAEHLSYYGASATEIENYITGIARSLGLKAEIAAVGTVIHMTLIDNNKSSITRIARVNYSEINFEKLSEMEKIIDKIIEKEIELDEARKKVKNLEKSKNNMDITLIESMFGVFVASFAFCFVFKGTIIDSFASGITGWLVYLIVYKIDNKILKDFLAGFLIHTIIRLFGLFVAINMYPTLSGGIMGFVPGLLLTNAIMEIGDRNMVSGIVKLLEAFFILAALVLGAGLSSAIWR